MMTITVDKNITLQITAAEHALALLKLINANRTHLSTFLPWVNSMQSVADLTKYINNSNSLYEQGKEVSFVIFYNARLVGRIGLHHINTQNKMAAIGYWLDKNAEGVGIITKSCKALIQYAFSELELNRIEIKAAIQNIKSQAIPVKLGFQREGILRQAEWVNETFLDLYLFSLLKNDFYKPA